MITTGDDISQDMVLAEREEIVKDLEELLWLQI